MPLSFRFNSDSSERSAMRSQCSSVGGEGSDGKMDENDEKGRRVYSLHCLKKKMKLIFEAKVAFRFVLEMKEILLACPAYMYDLKKLHHKYNCIKDFIIRSNISLTFLKGLERLVQLIRYLISDI